MFLAFFILLMMCGGIGVLVWLGWQRVAAHLKNHPEAARILAEHVITPLLVGEKEPENKPPDKPEPKRIKGTLV